MDLRSNLNLEEDSNTKSSREPPRRGGGLHHITLTETIRKSIEP